MSSMWNSVKKYFSWNAATSANQDGESYQEKGDNPDMTMEYDENFQTNSALAGIYGDKGRYDTHSYFDKDYLDLTIDEGEDYPNFSHLNAEDDFRNFNELVEKAGIADLRGELMHGKDKTVTDMPTYSHKQDASDVDGSENESQGESEHDMDNESEGEIITEINNEAIDDKEGEENNTESSLYIDDKSAEDNDDSDEESIQIIEERTNYQHSDSDEDRDISNSVVMPQYYSDIFPDVSSEELSEDEPFERKVQKRSVEHPKDEIVTKKMKAKDLSSFIDLVNLEDKYQQVNKRLPEKSSTLVNNFELDNKPLQFNPWKPPSWNSRVRNMPVLGVIHEHPQELGLDPRASRAESTTEAEGKKYLLPVKSKFVPLANKMPELDNGTDVDMESCDKSSFLDRDWTGEDTKNDLEPVKSKFIPLANNMPELDNGTDVDMESCDQNSFLVRDGTGEDTQKQTQGSENSSQLFNLEEFLPDDKGKAQELKVPSHSITNPSSKRKVGFFFGMPKKEEVEAFLVKDSRPKTGNKESIKLTAVVHKRAILNEGKESVPENLSSTGCKPAILDEAKESVPENLSPTGCKAEILDKTKESVPENVSPTGCKAAILDEAKESIPQNLSPTGCKAAILDKTKESVPENVSHTGCKAAILDKTKESVSVNLSPTGCKPAILDEAKESVPENSSTTGPTENSGEPSLLSKEEINSVFRSIPNSNSVLKLDGGSDKRGQDESSITHGSIEKKECSSDQGTVATIHSSFKEQKSITENEISMERALEVNIGADPVVKEVVSVTLEKDIPVTAVENEQEARSERNVCQKIVREALTNDVKNSNDSHLAVGKLNSPTVSTAPKLVMGHENTTGNLNNQREELKSVCNRTGIQNNSEVEHDLRHSPSSMLLPGTPPGRPSFGVEMLMENGGIRLSITPSGAEVGNHVNRQEMSYGRTFCNRSCVSRQEMATEGILRTELTRMQNQNFADHRETTGKLAEPGILQGWFPASTAESGIQTVALRNTPRELNLDLKPGAQQASKIPEKLKSEVETQIYRRKEPNRELADSRVTSEKTSTLKFLLTNPLIGTQINEESSCGSGILSDKTLSGKVEKATQTSMIESSRVQNAESISDLQQILERIFGVGHQSNSLPSSKSNVETQTTVMAPSSSLNESGMACWNMNTVPSHNRSNNLCMVEGSGDGSESRFHCQCLMNVPYQSNLSSPASKASSTTSQNYSSPSICHCQCLMNVPYQSNLSSPASKASTSTSQNYSSPNRGPSQIKKLLDVVRHGRLEFNPTSPQTSKAVCINHPNMMDQSQPVVKCKGNSTKSQKSGQFKAESPQTSSIQNLNYVYNPTSFVGSGLQQVTPDEATQSGGKASRKRTRQKPQDSKGCSNLKNTSGDPGPSGINLAASPKKVAPSNPVIYISCSNPGPISIEGRELRIGQRPAILNPMIESGNANEGVIEMPTLTSCLESPLKQNNFTVIKITKTGITPVSANNSDRKAASGSHLLSILPADSLDIGHEISSPTIMKPTENSVTKSTGEAYEKKNGIDSIESEQALELNRQSINKEECSDESTPNAENAFKNKPATDKIVSDHNNKGNKEGKSSDKKKKEENDSSEPTKKSLLVTKSEQKLSPAKCQKKRKYPMTSKRGRPKKRKVENDFPKSTASHSKKVLRKRSSNLKYKS